MYCLLLCAVMGLSFVPLSCGRLTLPGCQMCIKLLFHSYSSTEQRQIIKWNNLWLKIKTVRLVTNYLQRQDKLNCRMMKSKEKTKITPSPSPPPWAQLALCTLDSSTSYPIPRGTGTWVMSDVVVSSQHFYLAAPSSSQISLALVMVTPHRLQSFTKCSSMDPFHGEQTASD